MKKMYEKPVAEEISFDVQEMLASNPSTGSGFESSLPDDIG